MICLLQSFVRCAIAVSSPLAPTPATVSVAAPVAATVAAPAAAPAAASAAEPGALSETQHNPSTMDRTPHTTKTVLGPYYPQDVRSPLKHPYGHHGWGEGERSMTHDVRANVHKLRASVTGDQLQLPLSNMS